ncbi:hypothetical protein OG233_01525 [Streptomyces sp. NBC_01218]|nr:MULTISPECIES: hypothetical protein [unclassified Streptomyces]WEH38289.1 hypothetical protein PZB77_01515 [Streptomyces sp. AM 2-1-1]WSQ49953.1 hypothetical protein OG233_01525 [Streptomyces sp. NBC_01218]
MGSDVAALAGWGFAGGRRVRDNRLHAVVTAVLNAVIGAGVVSVKRLAGH